MIPTPSDHSALNFLYWLFIKNYILYSIKKTLMSLIEVLIAGSSDSALRFFVHVSKFEWFLPFRPQCIKLFIQSLYIYLGISNYISYTLKNINEFS